MGSPIAGKTPSTGYRKVGRHWSRGYHTGVDYAVPVGTDVLAVADGVIENASWGKSYGIQGDNGPWIGSVPEDLSRIRIAHRKKPLAV